MGAFVPDGTFSETEIEVSEDYHAEIFNDYQPVEYNPFKLNTQELPYASWLNKGNIAAGMYATAMGTANMASGAGDFVAGANNSSLSNATWSCNAIFGQLNKTRAINSAMFGRNNLDYAPSATECNFIVGTENNIGKKVNDPDNYLGEYSLQSDYSYNHVSGVGNYVCSDNALVHGNGNLVYGVRDVVFGAGNYTKHEDVGNNEKYGTYNLVAGTGNKINGRLNYVFGNANNTSNGTEDEEFWTDIDSKPRYNLIVGEMNSIIAKKYATAYENYRRLQFTTVLGRLNYLLDGDSSAMI